MAAAKGKMADWSADDLERAAKFMRELDGSKNSKAALELARREQDVDIHKSKAKEKEHEEGRAHAAIAMERVKQEEFRKNQEHKRESEKVRTASSRREACLCSQPPHPLWPHLTSSLPSLPCPPPHLNARPGPHGLQAAARAGEPAGC